MQHKKIITSVARVVAVCISAGSVPKLPLNSAKVTKEGVAGDQHAHAKHYRPDRAVSIFDIERMRDLVVEGFPLKPGTAGENLTVEGLDVQAKQPGTLLQIGEVILQLETPRKPCYVLDKIDSQLQYAIAGRCGYMASVVREGTIVPGMEIRVVNEGATHAYPLVRPKELVEIPMNTLSK